MTGDYSGLLADSPAVAADIAREKDDAAALIAAHRHRVHDGRFGRLRSLFQGRAAAPAAPAASQDAEDDETGTFTGIVRDYQGSPVPFGGSVLDRPQAEVTHEPYDPEPTAAFGPAEIPDDLITDEHPDPRPYAPESSGPGAVPWGAWDTGRRPMRPSPVLILAADLTECPEFRETLARSTRNRAGQCLCGDEMAGQAWGERMMREGIHMLSVWDLPAVRTFAALPPAPAETEAVPDAGGTAS